MATDARNARLVWPVVGVGGFIEVEWARDPEDPDDTGYIPPGAAGAVPKPGLGEKLEVEGWELSHKFRNVKLPLSGGQGALSTRRVADDFTFACEVAMSTRAAKGQQTGSPFSREPFIDGMLQGLATHVALFHIGVRFQVGDPSFWGHRETQPIPINTNDKGMFYFCPRVLLVEVGPRVKRKGVVLVVVRGEGSAPLERWVDDVRVGFGGLGF